MAKKWVVRICAVIATIFVSIGVTSCNMLMPLNSTTSTQSSINRRPNASSDTSKTSSSSKDSESNKVTYTWYDNDGNVLYQEKIYKWDAPSQQPLPKDTEKWDYIEWKRTGSTGFYPYRVPQESYFAGNVFQIIVQNLGRQPLGSGSAFVFNSDGWFITNAHVMQNAYYATAIFNIPNEKTGESYTYLNINEGTYYHLDKDIYIGKIENYQSIKNYYKNISVNTSYKMGGTTYSVGYPNSSTELNIAEGEITETWSDLYEKLYSGNTYICSSSYIAPGSSGGILTNENLEVIGITTLGWFDENEKFISGAAISAFNFNNILKNTNQTELTSLIERFHSHEKAYVSLFNAIEEDCENGNAEIYYYDDGVLAYAYAWKNEGVNDDNVAYTYTQKIKFAADGFISYYSEFYWEDGDRREVWFYGYYDYKKEFENFKYEFSYKYGDGGYYQIECSQINYSANTALTLNKYKVASSSFKPSDSNITYAKEQFNVVYEFFAELMKAHKK